MTKRSSTPADAVLVAIDMSKHRQEVLIERPEGGRRRRMTVMATKADYDRLADNLSAIGRPIVVGFEATGNYHRTLAHRLLSAGFELRLISSVALARTREALHNGWDKNGSKDAQVIVHMLRIGATQRYVDPLAAGINDLQEMSKTREAISKAKTQTWHRTLTHYLPLYFPEIERFAGNSRSTGFWRCWSASPHPENADAGLAALEAFEEGHWCQKYPSIAQSWRRHWEQVIPFFSFSAPIRRMIYTTNAIEALNSKLRRAVRTRGHFPGDEAAMKLLYLVVNHAVEQWKRPPRKWTEAKTQFAIIFGDRFTL